LDAGRGIRGRLAELGFVPARFGLLTIFRISLRAGQVMELMKIKKAHTCVSPPICRRGHIFDQTRRSSILDSLSTFSFKQTQDLASACG
jgi:hypothetical protein